MALRVVLAAFLASAALAGFARAAAAPKDVVRALYAERTASVGVDASGRYFAHDLGEAMRKDTSDPQEVGALDFDYRYGAQDLKISGLQILETPVDNDSAHVVAVFKNHGKANGVEWTLCRRPNGDWRIADAASSGGEESWDLRQMLNLPSDRVRC